MPDSPRPPPRAVESENRDRSRKSMIRKAIAMRVPRVMCREDACRRMRVRLQPLAGQLPLAEATADMPARRVLHTSAACGFLDGGSG